MDLSTIEALHPSHDPERRLLVLWLDHGKANEMGSEQLDALTTSSTAAGEQELSRDRVVAQVAHEGTATR